MSTLKPPPGHESWLAYAIETMDTRGLHLASIWDDSHWGRIVQRNEMREAARAELDALHTIEGCAAARLDHIEKLDAVIERLAQEAKRKC